MPVPSVSSAKEHEKSEKCKPLFFVVLDELSVSCRNAVELLVFRYFCKFLQIMEMFIRLQIQVDKGVSNMVTIADVVKALKELIEISKRTEANTKEIAEIKEEIAKLREVMESRLDVIENGVTEVKADVKFIKESLDVWKRVTMIEEKFERLSETVAKLEEKVKT